MDEIRAQQTVMMRQQSSLEQAHQAMHQLMAELQTAMAENRPGGQGEDKGSLLTDHMAFIPKEFDSVKEQRPTVQDFRSWTKDMVRFVGRRYPELKSVPRHVAQG